MMKAVGKYDPSKELTEAQKKQLVGEIFYNERYLIESIKSDEDIRQIMNMIVNKLSDNEMQVRLQNIIMTDIQEKYKQLHPETIENKQNNNTNDTIENVKNSSNAGLGSTGLSGKLKNELLQVQKAYHSMLSDGYIDEDELITLIEMNNIVINDGYLLRSQATDPSDLKAINIIISSLEDQQKEMNKMQSGIEEIGKSL